MSTENNFKLEISTLDETGQQAKVISTNDSQQSVRNS